jgi:hypothetical protein
MEKYFSYDVARYQFVALINELFRHDLQLLHQLSDTEYAFFAEPGKDSDTIFHQKFYNKLRSGWKEFVDTYELFIRERIAPIMGSKDGLIYQTWPTLRVHLPGNVAVGGWHRDRDYNHPPGEINFVVAITPMFESNAIVAERNPGALDFCHFTMAPGQLAMFDGNQCIHGNLPNTTGKTRVSFDFRVLPTECYNPDHQLTSLSTGNRFLVGHYYQHMSL